MTRKKLFNPDSNEPFKLSRSKIDLFRDCPRCFFLDRKLGVSRPSGYPFNLNSAVDHLLKKEFDQYRELGKPHSLMTDNGIEAIPFKHEKLDDWRNNRRGVTHLHQETNFHLYGAIDDLWINTDGELFVVDYKATSKKDEVSLDADWQIGYKRQMEFYQWLLRKNGFKVSNTGYFVYCNGRKDRESFDAQLDFKISVIPYEGNDEWVESELNKIHTCLTSDSLPEANSSCSHCNYRVAALASEK